MILVIPREGVERLEVGCYPEDREADSDPVIPREGVESDSFCVDQGLVDRRP